MRDTWARGLAHATSLILFVVHVLNLRPSGKDGFPRSLRMFGIIIRSKLPNTVSDPMMVLLFEIECMGIASTTN